MKDTVLGRFQGMGTVVLALFVLSGVINILTLSGAFYMLQVYDRVLTSHSIETLIVLSALVAGLYVILGILDIIRAQILLRLGTKYDTEIMPRAYAAASRRAMMSANSPESAQPVRDVDTIRGFLSSPAPVAIFDLPWTPVFLIFVWLLSPALGLLTLGGLVVLVVIAWITDAATRKLERRAVAGTVERHQALDAAMRTSETATAMGFGPDIEARFLTANGRHTEMQTRSSDIVSALASISKVVRLMLQSAILGLGAYFAIKGQISPGAIVAASITAARALAPAELVIANWRSLTMARQSYRQLAAMLAGEPAHVARIELPVPRISLSAEKISVLPPGSRRLVLNSVSFNLRSGQGLAIIGRSGSGKSTLARALIGVCPLAHGVIRFDKAPLERWSAADRGQFIGYMPQQIELFPGTIAENIARLENNPSSKLVIAAATAAGIHDVILQLPEGYETILSPGGSPLSAGQRQQIGVARALYGNPFLIVLDEPNANLDSDAENALISALKDARVRGAIVVVVAHRRSLLNACDQVAVLEAGILNAFGPKSEVLEPQVASMHPRTSRSSAAKVHDIDQSRRTNA